MNPIALYSDIEGMLDAAPIRSRFTVYYSRCTSRCANRKASQYTSSLQDYFQRSRQCARVKRIFKYTCIIRRVPKWYSDEELMAFLSPQGVFSARRMIRRTQTNSTWETRRTDSVVVTFAQNTGRPEKINLGFTLYTRPSTTWRCNQGASSISVLDM